MGTSAAVPAACVLGVLRTLRSSPPHRLCLHAYMRVCAFVRMCQVPHVSFMSIINQLKSRAMVSCGQVAVRSGVIKSSSSQGGIAAFLAGTGACWHDSLSSPAPPPGRAAARQLVTCAPRPCWRASAQTQRKRCQCCSSSSDGHPHRGAVSTHHISEVM